MNLVRRDFMSVSQYTETDDERAERLPAVLERYAQDIDKYGRPIDSGLASVLRFAAKRLASTIKQDGEAPNAPDQAREE